MSFPYTRSLSEEDSKDRFDDADEDMDGFVTWAEYKAEEYDFGEEEVDLADPEMAEEWKLMEEDRWKKLLLVNRKFLLKISGSCSWLQT